MMGGDANFFFHPGPEPSRRPCMGLAARRGMSNYARSFYWQFTGRSASSGGIIWLTLIKKFLLVVVALFGL